METATEQKVVALRLGDSREALPTTAGAAALVFLDKNDLPDRTPQLDGSRILLPDDPENEFIALQGGTQFVFLSWSPGTLFYFGGTDESPFLVEIEYWLSVTLLEKGEAAFYARLKPELITMLEELLGVQARRQGDIWAMPLPITLEKVNELFDHLDDMGGTIETAAAGEEYPLLGTSHSLVGRWLVPDIPPSIANYEIVEGTITAEGHAPLVLDCPHIIMRSRGLVSAD